MEPKVSTNIATSGAPPAATSVKLQAPNQSAMQRQLEYNEEEEDFEDVEV